jgi:hypothetical protein
VNTGGSGAAGPPWWALLPPAQKQVSCGDQTHRLRWQEGSLAAVDHPDAEGELVLAALGGDRSECMDLVESWGARSDDLDVLAVGPRSAADELTVGPDDIAAMRSGARWGRPGHRVSFLAYAPLTAVRPTSASPSALLHPAVHRTRLARGAVNYGGFLRGNAPRSHIVSRRSRISGSFGQAVRHAAGFSNVHGGPQANDDTERDAARRTQLLSVLALGAEFQFRLSATVAAAWADGGSRAGDRAAARPALVAALAGGVVPTAQSWLGIDPGRVDVSLHEDSGWGRLALSGTGGDRRLTAALPAGWLASVWAAGLAVTAGHLVVAVTEAAWPDATVLAVPEPGAEPVMLQVRAAVGGWTVPEARK